MHETDATNHRNENIESARQYDRDRASLPHRAELRKRVQMEWKAAHPDRRAANVALGNAIQSGRVIPWPVCSFQECDCKPKAHPPDYPPPFDVVCLCPPHHKQTHAMARRLIKEERAAA